jgi:phosphoserine phosphatase
MKTLEPETLERILREYSFGSFIDYEEPLCPRFLIGGLLIDIDGTLISLEFFEQFCKEFAEEEFERIKERQIKYYLPLTKMKVSKEILKSSFTTMEIQPVYWARLLSGKFTTADAEKARRDYYKFMYNCLSALCAREVEELQDYVLKNFRKHLFPNVEQTLEELRNMPLELGITTTNFQFYAEPICRELGIKWFACSEAEVMDGKVSGKIKNFQIENKAFMTLKKVHPV